MNCKRPDHDTPELTCGWPLPCPWHTVTIDTTLDPPVINIPVTHPKAVRPPMLALLKEIANSIKSETIRVEPEKRNRRRLK